MNSENPPSADVFNPNDEEAAAKQLAAEVAERERLDFPGSATLDPDMVEALKTDSVTAGAAFGAPLDPVPGPTFGFVRLADQAIDELPDGYAERWTNHHFRTIGVSRCRLIRQGKVWMRVAVQHRNRMPNESEMFMLKDLFIGLERTAVEIRLASQHRRPAPDNTRVLFAQLDGSDGIPDLRHPKDGWL